MKRVLAGLALGALLCSPIHAATSIDTAAFSISYVDGPKPEDWSISLVDQSPGRYSFSLDTLNHYLAGIEARAPFEAGAFAETAMSSSLQLDIGAAYRVTRITFSSIVSGELVAGAVPYFSWGLAQNDLYTFLTVQRTMNWMSLARDFDGEYTTNLESAPLNLTGRADVTVSGSLSVAAWGAQAYGESAESLARASLRNLVLHVDVSPVPEPNTALMLLAGLGLSGVLARRHSRQVAQKRVTG